MEVPIDPDHERSKSQSIASHYTRCIGSFAHLFNLVEASSPPQNNFSPNVAEELGRFRVWAGNTGAHRTGRISLDYRLREASHIHAQVTKLLTDLLTDLEKAIHMLEDDNHQQDPGKQWEISFEDDPEFMEELGFTEEDGQPEIEAFVTLLSDITHIITCLYKFSMATRNAVPRDRLHKIMSIEVTHFEYWDIEHIRHKFPTAPSYLIQRLGIANTRRRQLMKYYREHHSTIARYIDHSLASEDRLIERKEVFKSTQGKQTRMGELEERERGSIINLHTTISNSIAAKSQTTVSTIKQDTFHIHKLVGVRLDEDQLSQTSYATSANHGHQRIYIAPPPNLDSAYNGTPFECPYCFQIISIRDRRGWRKHIFRDLQPYVCTHKDCPRPEKLYSSLHDWYGHEVQVHRREWYCNACSEAMPTRALFKEHVEQTHPEAQSNIKAVAGQCERTKTSDEACPLCGCTLTSSGVQKHLGGHFQEIALFTLPYFTNNGEDEGKSEREHSSEETTNDNRGRLSLESSGLVFDSNPDRESSGRDPLVMSTGLLEESEEFHSVYGPYTSPVEAQDDGSVVTPPPIEYAAKGNPAFDIVKLLLRNGADIDAVEKECGVTVLHLAVTESDAEVVQLLLEKGANLEINDTKHGLTPLHVAAQSKGNAAIIKLLLENGAKIESRCAFQGRTALHYAAMNGCLEIVKLLINEGANSKSALQAASEGGHLEVVKLLLEHKADVNAKPVWVQGRTALQAASGGGHLEVIKLL
ncbi:hypothetical protein EV426DRAFT_597392, partial [Tirmania nivea]